MWVRALFEFVYQQLQAEAISHAVLSLVAIQYQKKDQWKRVQKQGMMYVIDLMG